MFLNKKKYISSLNFLLSKHLGLFFQICFRNWKKSIIYKINLEWCYYIIKGLTVSVKQYLIYIFQESRFSSINIHLEQNRLCEIADFSNNFEMLQFQFDRWLYKTVSALILCTLSLNYYWHYQYLETYNILFTDISNEHWIVLLRSNFA